MKDITEIRNNISAELDRFNAVFDSAFSIEDTLLKEGLDHVRLQKGKQIRPILVIYLAKLSGALNDNTFYGAAAIEMLHTGSLVHDDVVDVSMQRRNRPSVNAAFDNRTAVLVGDYLLTKAMNFMSKTGDINMVNCLANIANEITRGELLQLQRSYTIPTEKEYTEIIKRKTAVLFSTCASVAAIAAGVTEEKRMALEMFGTYLGMCFQIKDDILDYTKDAEIGKPTFNDIREGKITLPLLHSLENMSTEEREYIMEKISKNNFDDGIIDYIYSNIMKYKGIDYAMERMGYYRNLAASQLDIFPDSIDKKTLVALSNYVLDRNN